MNFLLNVYTQNLAENEKSLNFWQDYLNNLNALDFSIYSDKLSVPILVPIGNKILFRGSLKHTNEITAALGADYFTKCSIKQAEELRQHRIKDAKSKVSLYSKEKEYLENQITFNKNKVYEIPGQDILETCTEDEDKLWREKHREKVRQYNQSAKKKDDSACKEIKDEELWARLEELELQEELESEYRSMTNRGDESNTEEFDSFIVKEEDDLKFTEDASPRIKDKESNTNLMNSKTHNEDTESFKLSKLDLFKQVLDKQKELEVKLTELKNKDRGTCQTERDLISKLDEMEQLDELEDEMDRLDDILNEDSDDTTGNSKVKPKPKLQKSVSFADDESQTLELNFKHSDMEPNQEPYNSDKGIIKPSDIYEAYSDLFVDERASILKKSKAFTMEQTTNEAEVEKNTLIKPVELPKQTIVVKDIVETSNSHELTSIQTRPVSLFKKRRQQKT